MACGLATSIFKRCVRGLRLRALGSRPPATKSKWRPVMAKHSAAAAEFRNGWRPLAGSMLGLAVGVHALPFGTSGLFLGPLTTTFGWSRAEASMGPTLLFLCLG